jgi:hypothetical protein
LRFWNDVAVQGPSKIGNTGKAMNTRTEIQAELSYREIRMENGWLSPGDGY